MFLTRPRQADRQTMGARFWIPLATLGLEPPPTARQYNPPHSQDSRDDPIPEAAIPRYPAMDDHIIIIRNNNTRLVPERRRRGLYEFEQPIAARSGMRRNVGRSNVLALETLLFARGRRHR